MSITLQVSKMEEREDHKIYSEILPEGFKYRYEYDPEYGRCLINQNPLSVSLSNSDFFYIMNLIGLPTFEYCGVVDNNRKFMSCMEKSFINLDGTCCYESNVLVRMMDIARYAIDNNFYLTWT